MIGDTNLSTTANDKKTSCGIIYLAEGTDKFLIGHVTMSKTWSIPKGCMDDAADETHKDAALREFKEETGVAIERPDDLVFLGKFDYRVDKDLVVFLYKATVPEATYLSNNAKCISTFSYTYKVYHADDRIEYRTSDLPEIDKYKFIHVDECDMYLNKAMATIVKQLFAEKIR